VPKLFLNCKQNIDHFISLLVSSAFAYVCQGKDRKSVVQNQGKVTELRFEESLDTIIQCYQISQLRYF